MALLREIKKINSFFFFEKFEVGSYFHKKKEPYITPKREIFNQLINLFIISHALLGHPKQLKYGLFV